MQAVVLNLLLDLQRRSSTAYLFTGVEIPVLRAGVPSFPGVPLARTPRDLEGADAAIIGVTYDRPATAGRPADQWAGYHEAPADIRRFSLRYAFRLHFEALRPARLPASAHTERRRRQGGCRARTTTEFLVSVFFLSDGLRSRASRAL